MSAPASTYVPPHDYPPVDPRVEALVNEVIGRVADKWTMLVLEVLAEHGELRFTRIGEQVGGISQKMLTQTLRNLERDGLVRRTLYPQVPPRVEYELTDSGTSLRGPLRALEEWAVEHMGPVSAAQAAYDEASA